MPQLITQNALFYEDNLDILREYVADSSPALLTKQDKIWHPDGSVAPQDAPRSAYCVAVVQRALQPVWTVSGELFVDLQHRRKRRDEHRNLDEEASSDGVNIPPHSPQPGPNRLDTLAGNQ